MLLELMGESGLFRQLWQGYNLVVVERAPRTRPGQRWTTGLMLQFFAERIATALIGLVLGLIIAVGLLVFAFDLEQPNLYRAGGSGPPGPHRSVSRPEHGPQPQLVHTLDR